MEHCSRFRELYLFNTNPQTCLSRRDITNGDDMISTHETETNITDQWCRYILPI